MAMMFPSAAGQAQAAFNPARWYAEIGQSANEIPGSSTQHPFAGAFRGIYLPLLVLVIFLWALERRRVGASLKGSLTT
ncbi:MAG TPA: hypothetical protein VGU27_12730 [Candidatus Eisenbacteria bacterium]|nr:hypothetical protein [Candidatus Eisenbacteria bacterium]